MKKVSVIVPVYNAEKLVEKAIKSVLNQTYKSIELILINDGSKDNSLNIIKKWEKKYPNIIKIFDQENMGVGKTRNKGIEVSTGDYITFLDADDYLDKEFVEELIRNIGTNDVVISGDRAVGNDGKINLSQELKNNDWSKFRQVSIWAKLYKREFLIKNKIKFNNLKIAEDIVFSMSVYANTSKIKVIPYIGYNYFDNVVSVTHDFELKKNNDILETIKVLGDITSNKKFLENNRIHIRNFYYKIFCSYLFDKAIVLSLDELKDYYYEGFSFFKTYFKKYNLKFKFNYIIDEPIKVNAAIFLLIVSYKFHFSNLFLKLVHKTFYRQQ